MGPTPSHEQLIQTAVNRIFSEYDTDNSGKIDPKELSHYLVKASKNSSLPRSEISPEEIQRVLDRLDRDNDQKLDKEEVKNLIRMSYEK